MSTEGVIFGVIFCVFGAIVLAMCFRRRLGFDRSMVGQALPQLIFVLPERLQISAHDSLHRIRAAERDAPTRHQALFAAPALGPIAQAVARHAVELAALAAVDLDRDT